MPYKKKAPAKRTKKAVGGALSAAQKRVLGEAQAGAVKKGAGAITKKIVGMTHKYGDQRKAASAPAKRKAPTSSTGRIMKQMTPAQVRALRARGQTAKPKKGGIAMSATARANLMRMQREAFKTGKSNAKLESLTKKHGMLVKRGDAQKQMQSQRGSTSRRRMPTAAQLAAAKRRGRMTLAQKRAQMAAAKRRAGSKMPRIMSTITGARKAKEIAAKRRAPTAAQRRAQMAVARRRALAAARKRRAPSRRVKSPVRRPSGLSRAGLALRARRAAAARRARSAGRPTSRRTPARRPVRRMRRR